MNAQELRALYEQETGKAPFSFEFPAKYIEWLEARASERVVPSESLTDKVKELLLFCENSNEVVNGFRVKDIVGHLRVLVDKAKPPTALDAEEFLRHNAIGQITPHEIPHERLVWLLESFARLTAHKAVADRNAELLALVDAELTRCAAGSATAKTHESKAYVQGGKDAYTGVRSWLTSEA